METLKVIYIVFGTLFLCLGLVGIVLPVLPTTPFLLLTAYCYGKGSDQFNNWFINTKIYQRYLANYVNNRSMTLGNKIRILLFADFMLLFPLLLLDNKVIKYFIVTLIIVKYYYFIFKIETLK
ncbi:YbaN family protein [Mycoplasmatota bacterium WC44]